MIELTEEKMKDVIEIANFEKDFIIDDICKFTISPVNGMLTAYTNLTLENDAWYSFIPIENINLHAVYFTVEEYDCPIEDTLIGYIENHYVEELKIKLEEKFEVKE